MIRFLKANEMKDAILNHINSTGFKNLLGKTLILNDPRDFTMLEVKKTPSLKNRGGLYFMYDKGSFKKDALWYLGINGNTLTETFRHRIIKHRRHALQLKSKSGNNKNWLAFNSWLVSKGYDQQNGYWDINCRVLWLEISNQLTNQELQLLEQNCISNLNPIINDSIDWNQLNTL